MAGGSKRLRRENFLGVPLEIRQQLRGTVLAADGARSEKLAEAIEEDNPNSRPTWNLKLRAGEDEKVTYQYKIWLMRKAVLSLGVRPGAAKLAFCPRLACETPQFRRGLAEFAQMGHLRPLGPRRLGGPVYDRVENFLSPAFSMTSPLTGGGARGIDATRDVQESLYISSSARTIRMFVPRWLTHSKISANSS